MHDSRNIPPLIGKRVTMLREELGLTQEQLAARLGIASRQSVQAMESGKRKIQVEELLALMDLSGRPLSYFTDPFTWEGEGNFSFRLEPEGRARLGEYEKVAGDCAMLWQYLMEFAGIRVTSKPGIGISVESSYEDVANIANTLVSWLGLGAVPSLTLADIIEEEFLIPVLHVDAPKGISGATFHNAGVNIIFINRNEVAGRRNFNVAHEFFHALTWAVAAPPREDTEGAGSRTAARWEQLANVFASNILMPDKAVRSLWEDIESRYPTTEKNDIPEMVREAAGHFQVTRPAMYWRLVDMRLVDPDAKHEILSGLGANPQTDGAHSPQCTPLSKLLLRHLADTIGKGGISVRKACSILRCEIDSLADAYRNHGLAIPFEL